MKMTFKKLDYRAIALGIIDMMTEKQKALIAFGMIDKPIMDSLESNLKEKYLSEFERIMGATIPEIVEEVEGTGLTLSAIGECKRWVQLSIKEIVVLIYKNSKMVC